ncbi:MAG: helicase-related protein [Thaumarchaeota archaeon]|nr:helicase-related protein [Nitrososphaerota archaeon]
MIDSKISLSSQTERTTPRPSLPILSIIHSINFDDHFVLLGDVGTGKTTVTPIHEFKKNSSTREIVIREPSRAACNALYYSLEALHPEVKMDLAVITKDIKINVDGAIKIVTDGVLLRMLAENSLNDVSIYFDESHQMTSQLELCMSLAKKNSLSGVSRKNLFRIMSATIDPAEFLSFMQIKNLYTISGRRFPVSIELEMAKDTQEMFDKLSYYLYAQPENESWLVFLPTRRLVEKYARSYGGVYLHGGLEGSEVNKIQQRAELDKNLKIFATNVIASSVNIYVDNVLIFNETIEGRDKLGHKVLEYKSIDNNSLLQMIGRIGRFKPGRAVLLSDVPIPKTVLPIKVFKALERETPFDLVLLMSKYGLKLTELEFMSKLNQKEIEFAQDWLFQIGAIHKETHTITEKGLLMTEIPYDPDFAHMISEALLRGDRDVARFLLASGAFGDSLNHAYKSEMEGLACEFLYALDKTSELGVKAKLLKKYSEDGEGRFVSTLADNGIFTRFLDEAWKNYVGARDSLNDILVRDGKEEIPREVEAEVSSSKLEEYLKDCLTFERFYLHEADEFGLDNLRIEGDFFARSLTMNFRKILYDIVALED